MALAKYTTDGTWDAGAVEGYPWLYVGSLPAAESHSELVKHNITRVLTVAKNLPVRAFPDSVQHHLQVDIQDHPKENFFLVAQPCVDFIQQAAADAQAYATTAAGKKKDGDPPPSILVHCASGVSRSVTAILF